VDAWTTSAQITDGRLFRSINKAGKIWGDGMTPKVIWEIVKHAAGRAGIEKLAPHNLRRTCARLCHLAGGELDQIQFLLGHVSIQTTTAHNRGVLSCGVYGFFQLPLSRLPRGWSEQNFVRRGQDLVRLGQNFVRPEQSFVRRKHHFRLPQTNVFMKRTEVAAANVVFPSMALLYGTP
jgi:hypothetical protein